MPLWIPSNSPTPPGGANSHYNTLELDLFQQRFRDLWIVLYDTHMNLGDDWGNLGAIALNSLLAHLLWPAREPMSDDPRKNYQIFLPRAVWSDLPRVAGRGFKFPLLVKHFDCIMEMYFGEPTEVFISWKSISFYSKMVQLLDHQNELTSQTWVGLMQEVTTALLLPWVPENYVSTLQRAGSCLEKELLNHAGYAEDPDMGVTFEFGGYTLTADALTLQVAPAPVVPQPPPPQTMGHDQAVAYVMSLDRVNMVEHPSAQDRCPFCWSKFDGSDAEPDEPSGLAVCKTPCNHLFHDSCLIQILEQSSTLCSVCARELRV